jgi:TRAP-type C4-dicarboxylate transport system permease small subunit
VTDGLGGPEGPQPGPEAGRGLLWKALDSAEEVLCYSLLGGLVIVASLQVFTRYVLNAPFTWTEELARMLFTWINFLGAALIVKKSSHISIDFLVKILPPGPRRWLLVVSHSVVLTVVLILAVKGFRLLQITGASASPALNVPWAYVYAAFPVGMSLMAFRYGRTLLALLRGAEPVLLAGASAAPPESRQ